MRRSQNVLGSVTKHHEPYHPKTKCIDELDPKTCGLCLQDHWGSGRDLAKAHCPETDWDFVTLGLCFCGPLNPKSCVTKISGVCNAYHTNVTLDNGIAKASRRRRGFGCTATPGGRCQVGKNGNNAGEQILDCSGYNKKAGTCFYTTGPTVRSADNRTNFQFWSNHSSRSIVGMSSDNSGQPAGNSTYLAHTCGYHEQWSVVVDTNGAYYLHESQDGLECPDGLFPTSSAVELLI